MTKKYHANCQIAYTILNDEKKNNSCAYSNFMNQSYSCVEISSECRVDDFIWSIYMSQLIDYCVIVQYNREFDSHRVRQREAIHYLVWNLCLIWDWDWYDLYVTRSRDSSICCDKKRQSKYILNSDRLIYMSTIFFTILNEVSTVYYKSNILLNWYGFSNQLIIKPFRSERCMKSSDD